MSIGLAHGVVDQLLLWLANGAATQPGDPKYIQWHTGDPEDEGTQNIASMFPNRDIIAGTTPFWQIDATSFIVNGYARIKNTTAGESSAASGTGTVTITHFSVWDAAVNGNFLFSGTTTNKTIAVNEKLTYAAGALTVSITGAA